MTVTSSETTDVRQWFLEFYAHRDHEVRARLIESHLGLAAYLARRFEWRRGEPIDDLVQVASLGLVKAVDRFDPTRGVEFTTYAVPTILGELKRHFRDKGWSLRVPRRLQELHLEVTASMAELTQQLGRAPTITEIAERIGTSPEEVLEALEASSAYRSASLDQPAADDEDGGSLGSRLGSEDPDLSLVEDRSELASLLRRLPPREQKILLLRFFEGLTQTEIAAQVGISQMHVSRLLSRALQRLREMGTSVGLDAARTRA